MWRCTFNTRVGWLLWLAQRAQQREVTSSNPREAFYIALVCFFFRVLHLAKAKWAGPVVLRPCEPSTLFHASSCFFGIFVFERKKTLNGPAHQTNSSSNDVRVWFRPGLYSSRYNRAGFWLEGSFHPTSISSRFKMDFFHYQSTFIDECLPFFKTKFVRKYYYLIK